MRVPLAQVLLPDESGEQAQKLCTSRQGNALEGAVNFSQLCTLVSRDGGTSEWGDGLQPTPEIASQVPAKPGQVGPTSHALMRALTCARHMATLQVGITLLSPSPVG